MKKLIMGGLVAAGLFGLAACGGGGGAKAKLVKACMDEPDSTQELCDCMANAAVEELDKDMLKIMVDMAEQSDQSSAAAMEMMSKLTPDQTAQMTSFMMSAAMTCGMS